MARQLALLETRDDDQWRLDELHAARSATRVSPEARRILHEALAAAREHDTAA